MGTDAIVVMSLVTIVMGLACLYVISALYQDWKQEKAEHKKAKQV